MTPPEFYLSALLSDIMNDEQAESVKLLFGSSLMEIAQLWRCLWMGSVQGSKRGIAAQSRAYLV